MSIIKTFVGPNSKYNKSLPFTYEARVKALETDDTVINHFYADTLCALVDYVRISEIEPEEVNLFAVYQKKEIFIDSKPLLDESGKWLKRPFLCRSLEDHYNKTLKEQYQGHKLKEDCAYVDRDKWVI
ncbi:MAG TPA: hypothetical protein ACFCUD_14065 [Cyclobacteriaceae bacterium]